MGMNGDFQVLISALSLFLRRQDSEKLLTELKGHICKKCMENSTGFKYVRYSLV